MALQSQVLNDDVVATTIKLVNDNGDAEARVVKVDISALSFLPGDVKVDGIEYQTKGMGVNIAFEGDVVANDGVIATLPADDAHDVCYRKLGGIINNATNPTGNIIFTTVDAAAGNAYAITLYLKKRKQGRAWP